ncbi:hypothetical protein G7077_09195 [Sphingomonas piscis]|uniref:Uncharacterized protein n=1 Tax=Sphingomonas piscis TaxID=2714943 RepID=A0A6G7YQM4_9SPHN|nr:hypothetical protein [Sphingomonas piscis]QIK79041.1 hypothetical protein G7077_09195 [Sphingomonas piscis]
MTAATTFFLVVGVIALIAGIALMTVAIRGGVNDRPRNHMMLIAGMMSAAFGLILGGFAIGYATTAPLDFNTSEPDIQGA